MITFEKSKRYLFYYVGVLLVTITLFISWVVMIVKNPGSTSGDIVLLSFLFLILFGGEALFLIIYLIRPKVVLSVDEEGAYLHLSKKKTKEVAFSNFSSVGNMRRNLVIATKDSELYVVRFLKDHKKAEETLKTMFNTFITNHPECYFDMTESADKQKHEEK
ncbi:MAG TPA: hypothetical protein PLM11_04200 [Bacilli bacterium]|nr:hypothetical protein [Bacilli bacterium]HQB96641.1 hypothetical protein [Bacilli bacterium]